MPKPKHQKRNLLPVTYEEFKKYAYWEELVDKLFKIKSAGNTTKYQKLKNSEATKERALRLYYEAFYLKPEVRDTVPIRFRPVPQKLKAKLLQIPKQADVVKQNKNADKSTENNTSPISKQYDSSNHLPQAPESKQDLQTNDQSTSKLPEVTNVKNVNEDNMLNVMETDMPTQQDPTPSKSITISQLSYKDPPQNQQGTVKQPICPEQLQLEKTAHQLSTTCNKVDISKLHYKDLIVYDHCCPVQLKDFEKYTNTKELLRITYQGRKEGKDESSLGKSLLQFYLRFYLQPEGIRHKSFCKQIKVNDNCPLDIKKKIFEIPKNIYLKDVIQQILGSVVIEPKQQNNNFLPVSYDKFKQYVYCEELVDKLVEIESKGNTNIYEELTNSETAKETTLRKYYEAFYLRPEIRETIPIRFRPVPRKLKDKLLQIPMQANLITQHNIENIFEENNTSVNHLQQTQPSKRALQIKDQPTSKRLKVPNVEITKKDNKHHDANKSNIAETQNDLKAQKEQELPTTSIPQDQECITTDRICVEQLKNKTVELPTTSKSINIPQLMSEAIPQNQEVTVKESICPEQLQLKNTQQLPATSKSENNNSLLPVSYEEFKKYAYWEELVDKLFKIKSAGNTTKYQKLKKSEATKERALRLYYEAFYLKPEVRDTVPIRFKPMPRKLKDKMLQIPKQADLLKQNTNADKFTENNTSPITTQHDSSNHLPQAPASKQDRQTNGQSTSKHPEATNGKIVNGDNLLNVMETDMPTEQAISEGCQNKIHEPNRSNIAKPQYDLEAQKEQAPQPPTISNRVDISKLNCTDLMVYDHCCPVQLKDFEKYTNTKELLRITYQGREEGKDESSLGKLLQQFYLRFYLQPERIRHKSFCKQIKANDNCPLDIKKKIFEIPKNIYLKDVIQQILDSVVIEPKQQNTNFLPVSYDKFKQYVYCEELVAKLIEIESKGNTNIYEELTNSETAKETALRKYYEAFYLRPEIRETIPIRFRPVPRKLKDKFLQIPMQTDLLKQHKIENIENSTSVNHLQQTSPSKRVLQIKDQPTSKRLKVPTVEITKKDNKYHDVNKSNIAGTQNDLQAQKEQFTQELATMSIPQDQEITKKDNKYHDVNKSNIAATQNVLKAQKEQFSQELPTTFIPQNQEGITKDRICVEQLKNKAEELPTTSKSINIPQLMSAAIPQNQEVTVKESICPEQLQLKNSSNNINLSQLMYKDLIAYEHCCPVQFKDFENYTNSKQLISETNQQRYGKDESELAVVLHHFYLQFYLQPERIRRTLFCRKLKANDNCPSDLKRKLFLIPANIILKQDNRPHSLANTMPEPKQQNNNLLPVSYDEFKKYAYWEELVDKLFKLKSAGNTTKYRKLKKSEATKERALRIYYEAFYLKPEVRDTVPIRFRPVPRKLKDKLLQIPKQADLLNENTNAYKSTDTIPCVKQKPIILENLLLQSPKPKPMSRTTERTLESKEQKTNTVQNTVQRQLFQPVIESCNTEARTTEISKDDIQSLLNKQTLSCFREMIIRKCIEPFDCTNFPITFDKFKQSYLVPLEEILNDLTQQNEEITKYLLMDQELCDVVSHYYYNKYYTSSTLHTKYPLKARCAATTATSTSAAAPGLSQNNEQPKQQPNTNITSKPTLPIDQLTQCLEGAGTTDDENHALPYLLRTSFGLKHNIIRALFSLTFEEFRTLTSVYEGELFYNDSSDHLKQLYKYVFQTCQIWPTNLFITLNDLCKFLQTKNIIFPNYSTMLMYISPKFLHWSNLCMCTNFQDCVAADYERRTGNQLNVNNDASLQQEYNNYYNRCWKYEKWIGAAPLVNEQIVDELQEVCETLPQQSLINISNVELFDTVDTEEIAAPPTTESTNTGNNKVDSNNTLIDHNYVLLPCTQEQIAMLPIETEVQVLDPLDQPGCCSESLNSTPDDVLNESVEIISNGDLQISIKNEPHDIKPLKGLLFCENDNGEINCTACSEDIVVLDDSQQLMNSPSLTLQLLLDSEDYACDAPIINLGQSLPSSAEADSNDCGISFATQHIQLQNVNLTSSGSTNENSKSQEGQEQQTEAMFETRCDNSNMSAVIGWQNVVPHDWPNHQLMALPSTLDFNVSKDQIEPSPLQLSSVMCSSQENFDNFQNAQRLLSAFEESQKNFHLTDVQHFPSSLEDSLTSTPTILTATTTVSKTNQNNTEVNSNVTLRTKPTNTISSTPLIFTTLPEDQHFPSSLEDSLTSTPATLTATTTVSKTNQNNTEVNSNVTLRTKPTNTISSTPLIFTTLPEDQHFPSSLEESLTSTLATLTLTKTVSNNEPNTERNSNILIPSSSLEDLQSQTNAIQLQKEVACQNAKLIKKPRECLIKIAKPKKKSNFIEQIQHPIRPLPQNPRNPTQITNVERGSCSTSAEELQTNSAINLPKTICISSSSASTQIHISQELTTNCTIFNNTSLLKIIDQLPQDIQESEELSEDRTTVPKATDSDQATLSNSTHKDIKKYRLRNKKSL